MAFRQRSQSAYGVNQPTVETSPEPIRAQRDPNSDDFAEVGTVWINESDNSSFILVELADNNATWYGTANAIQRVNNGVQILSGEGDPNDSVTAPAGSIYLNRDPDGPEDRLYINTGGEQNWADVTFNN